MTVAVLVLVAVLEGVDVPVDEGLEVPVPVCDALDVPVPVPV